MQNRLPRVAFFHVMNRRLLPSLALGLAIVLGACGGETNDASSPPPIVLTESGIGEFEVGDPFDLVNDRLIQLFGGPDADSDEIGSTVYVPSCGGVTDRLVSWGNFIVMYTGDANDLRLASWTYGFDPTTGGGDDVRGLGLTTDEGIGLGATQREVERAYPGSASFTEAPALDSVLFTLGNIAEHHISGRLQPDVGLMELEPTCE